MKFNYFYLFFFEAIKKFDGDYDVLYNYVKNKQVGESSFRDIILPYFEAEEDLIEIETEIEALTIFIPSLPQNSFSAETWDTSKDTPLVAIKLLNNDKTPLIDSQGQNYLLGPNIIPGGPIVVIKECERITVPSFDGYKSNNNTEYVNGNFKFKFSNPFFNFIINIETNDGTPESLIEAWEVNGEHQNIGWHRDHIYYNISQANSNGQFINNYSEFLKDFRMEGTPENALSSIAQSSSVNSNLSDPSLKPIIRESGGVSQGSFWTDGDFEFNVHLEYDANQSPLEKAFTVNPEELFDLTYSEIDPGFFNYSYYYITDMELKTYPLNLDMLTWRLHDYSNEWKLTFEEQDLNVQITSNETYESTFNMNFSFNVGEATKIGAEFGASAEETRTSSITRTYTEQSNDLKMALVHFGDNAIIDQGGFEFSSGFIHWSHTYYDLKRYTTGKCSFSLVPLKVQ